MIEDESDVLDQGSLEMLSVTLPVGATSLSCCQIGETELILVVLQICHHFALFLGERLTIDVHWRHFATYMGNGFSMCAWRIK